MPVTKVKSKWESGALQFYETSAGTELLTIDPARIHEQNEFAITAYLHSAETSGFAYVASPHSGAVSRVIVVNQAATSAVVSATFVPYVSGVALSAVSLASGTASGVATVLTPAITSGLIDANGVLSLEANGEMTGHFPVIVTFVVRR